MKAMIERDMMGDSAGTYLLSLLHNGPRKFEAFGAPGVYTLQLTGSDNGFTTRESVKVNVKPSGMPPEPGDQLAAHWELDETTGDAVDDSSGNSRHGIRRCFCGQTGPLPHC